MATDKKERLQMMKRRRRRDLSGPMQKWIEDKALVEGWTPKQIFDYIDKLKPADLEKFLEELKADYPPPIHTIQRIVKDVTIRDTSGPWSATDSPPEDARLILDVLANMIAFQGVRRVFTKAEAAWILRVRKMAPGLRLADVFNVARSYMLAESKGESTQGLDAVLAFKPWENKNRADNYMHALEQGSVDEAAWHDSKVDNWGWGRPARNWADLHHTVISSIREQRKIVGPGPGLRLPRALADEYWKWMDVDEDTRKRILAEAEEPKKEGKKK